jgi:hypothetical protein
LNEADLEEQAGVLSELEWWRSEEREEPDEPGSFYEEHLHRKTGSERKSRVPPVGNGHKVVTKIRIGGDSETGTDSGTAVRTSAMCRPVSLTTIQTASWPRFGRARCLWTGSRGLFQWIQPRWIPATALSVKLEVTMWSGATR